MGDRLGIDPAGGVDRAHAGQERPEFIERAEMGRRPPQDVDEGLLGVLPPVERAKKHRALDPGVDGVVTGRPMRQQVFQLLQSGFLRQPGRPAGSIADCVLQRSRALFQSGHDAPRFDIEGPSTAPLSADSHALAGIPTMPVTALHCQIFPAAVRDIKGSKLSAAARLRIRRRQGFVYHKSTMVGPCPSP